MKRALLLIGIVSFCSILPGCTSDQSEAVEQVVQLMNTAAGNIGSITKAVQTAIDKHEKDKKAIDFTEAIKAAGNLEATGKKANELKVRQIQNFKPPDDATKQKIAEEYRTRITTAFTELVDAKKKLDEVLQKAEAINKAKVDDLRSKIRQAEEPFDALNRQG
jgi:hypothetical protein